MERYEKYKPSRVTWLPEIPAHWEMSKAKYYFQYTTGFTPPTGAAEFYNGDITWVTIADMNQKIVFDSTTKLSQTAIDKYNPDLTLKDSLLYSFKLSVGKVAYAGKDLYTNEAIISILPNEKYDLRYFYFTLPEQLLQNASDNIYGAKMLNQELIRNAAICFPPKEEQTAVADYLDKKTSQIYTLIEKKKRLIELLKEERTAIINQAVTKGINPKAKLKSSGIDWLGDIPEHWGVKKLKYVARFRSGDSITSDAIREEGEYPVFGGNGLRGYTSSFTHEGNYVLIGRQGALCGNINYANRRFWASEHAVVATLLDECNILWFGELLRSMNLNQYSQSAAQPGLAVERIQNLSIPVPVVEEQNIIGEYIELHNTRISGTIQKIEKEIDLLQEYRTALISEVVTGKIKVV